MAATRKCFSTDDEFREAVAESLSVAQVLGRIAGWCRRHYKTVNARIARLGLDTSHFTGAAWNQGARYRMLGPAFSWENILVENSTYTSTYRLRNRLIEHWLKEPKCEVCGLAEWQQQPIPLELHHANGINNDHRLTNLQVLCPNCHALMGNYRGKNQSRKMR
ncbi:HNH endonuclease signature motif containing protein [Hymenobacter sp. M29]|uniref:HNH endonuclease signature motif containing protein n=1 Tax=Hymenobacter mellowenesis TaxID=3063995 RepID=A0ABT9AGC7_9BACT|nr:HNH endonuclease signature motif containing protein [Hymenobacter sp. M29]MDO7848417.1 HNH endonuclease signature motif containing protein [Hymenobacter sp. M29]